MDTVIKGLQAYHDKKAQKKPSHAKVKTRPYTLMGLRAGIVLAFLLIGLISGALKSIDGLKTIMFVERLADS